MRCRMRCGDIRRCGGPIRKPTPPTPPGPSQFNVVNGIFVDVNMSGTGTRKNTRAMGDRFTAKVFMLNEDNPNYVLLEWTHGGATSMALMGLANDEHTQNMFADAIRNKLAREIETMYDNGEIENGFVKFTDDDWTKIQEYYATDLTPESVAALQAELMDNAIVREPEQNCFAGVLFSNGEYSVSKMGVGKDESTSAYWRGLPFDQHIVDPVVYEIGDESIATITNYTVHPAGQGRSEQYSGDILGVNMGQTTITFYSVNNPRGTKTVIPVTVTPPESYYYINLHEDTGEINVEEGNTYTCYAEVEDYRVGDTLAASGYDDTIISVEVIKEEHIHGEWYSDWTFNITGLQAGETTLRISSVNNPEVYEDLLITVSERCPASIQYVWGNDATIEVGQTATVITNFTTTAECENVDYSNIVAYVRASYNVSSDVATASIDFNENKVYVTGVKAGECTVVFTDGDRSWSNNVTVTAPTPPAHATISSGSENVTMAPGDTVTKRISFSPSDADTSNITWTNSDSNVANGSQQLLLEGMCDTVIDAYSEGTCTVTVSDGTNSYVYNVTVVGSEPEQSYTLTINVENLPEGADINGEIMDPETGETLEEISVSSFPITIDALPSGAIELNGNSHEGDGDMSITSYGEEGVGNSYQINISCGGYKPLFEATGFDLEDIGDGSYTGYIDTATLDSDVSLTISFAPVEEPESHTFTINVENAPEGVHFDNSGETLEDFPIILDIPSGGSFNGACNSYDGDGDLNVTIYDTPDGSSEGVVNELNIGCDGYKPLFEAVGFDLEDVGDGGYNFKKGDNYQIVPDSDASLTISFTPVE